MGNLRRMCYASPGELNPRSTSGIPSLQLRFLDTTVAGAQASASCVEPLSGIIRAKQVCLRCSLIPTKIRLGRTGQSFTPCLGPRFIKHWHWHMQSSHDMRNVAGYAGELLDRQHHAPWMQAKHDWTSARRIAGQLGQCRASLLLRATSVELDTVDISTVLFAKNGFKNGFDCPPPDGPTLAARPLGSESERKFEGSLAHGTAAMP